ncbi:hypothetical protein POPTR_003G095701v4 [Populus trichocarpa]|uniref:Uncharacterized protein n=2 Tax=Populus trichocarpa TaxID=3694 RepID=A0ACC0T8T6_POPTR|nr:hypothetical protein BDE02_03G085300 [Populus trichocarpa]KAI9397892.1 hypothetical protein POPTR_003G095701v4 [Populus trichocarpa]RQO88107.1 hypothetical protein POPTR_003G095701v4 [Populus trichocarpa]
MELADRAVGFLLSLISILIFTYYTFWAIRGHFLSFLPSTTSVFSSGVCVRVRLYI